MTIHCFVFRSLANHTPSHLLHVISYVDAIIIVIIISFLVACANNHLSSVFGEVY